MITAKLPARQSTRVMAQRDTQQEVRGRGRFGWARRSGPAPTSCNRCYALDALDALDALGRSEFFEFFDHVERVVF